MQVIQQSRAKRVLLYVYNSFKYLLYPYFQFYRLSISDLKQLTRLKKERYQKKTLPFAVTTSST